MSMNKEDLRALLSIAKKQGWNGKPAAEVVAVTLQFSEDMGINLSDIEGLLVTEELRYQLEYEYEEKEKEYEEYDLSMVKELAWYNHARMIGWE